MRVDDGRIRKEKVADSKISGYVWTGPKNPHAQMDYAFLVQAMVACNLLLWRLVYDYCDGDLFMIIVICFSIDLF